MPLKNPSHTAEALFELRCSKLSCGLEYQLNDDGVWHLWDAAAAVAAAVEHTGSPTPAPALSDLFQSPEGSEASDPDQGGAAGGGSDGGSTGEAGGVGSGIGSSSSGGGGGGSGDTWQAGDGASGTGSGSDGEESTAEEGEEGDVTTVVISAEQVSAPIVFLQQSRWAGRQVGM